MHDFIHFAEHRLQEIALLIMALVYTTRLIWLFRFKAGKERQAKTGLGDTSKKRGIIYSWFNIANPTAMESTRTKFFIYLQFVLFHLGVVAAITQSFFLPYLPQLLEAGSILANIFQVVIGAACIVGVLRIIRRTTDKFVRALSSPDDHFSLLLLTTWFAFAYLTIPGNFISNLEWTRLAYFLLTAFFLIYVPFSKISHYLYYPITRYYFGKTMGHRGVYPIRRVGAEK